MEIAIIICAVLLVALIAIPLRIKLNKTKRRLMACDAIMNSADFKFEIRLYPNIVEVYGYHWYGIEPKTIAIKRYPYTDPDSRDYAIRCAEELIEKLEEKI